MPTAWGLPNVHPREWRQPHATLSTRKSIWTNLQGTHTDQIMISAYRVEYFSPTFNTMLSTTNILIDKKMKSSSICRQQLFGDTLHIKARPKKQVLLNINHMCSSITNWYQSPDNCIRDLHVVTNSSKNERDALVPISILCLKGHHHYSGNCGNSPITSNNRKSILIHLHTLSSGGTWLVS